MFERFTREARAVVMAAVGEAARRGDRHIGTEHLLLGILASPEPTSSTVVAAHGLDLPTARRVLDESDAEALSAVGLDVDVTLGPDRFTGSRGQRSGVDHRPFTDGAKQVLTATLREAVGLRHRRIGPAHMLLALSRRDEPDPGGHLLRMLGASPEDVRHDLDRRLRTAA